MDIPIKKKPPIVKYRYHILGGVLFLVFVVYVIIAGSGPRRIRYGADKVEIVEVRQSKFFEFVDVEGIVQPIMTIKLSSLETGIVERIVAEEGSMLNQGDTILILTNPDLIRNIEDESDELERQRITYEERKLEMERRSSQLRRQAMETTYRLERLSKQYLLDQEEFQIGIKSKAQLEVATDEYNFNRKNTAMLLQELQHDSLLNILQTQLMINDFMNKEKRFTRSEERLDNLIVKAPISAQLSYLNVIWGDRVTAGNSIGELKKIDQFKVNTRISEFYIDRITNGLPATVIYQNRRFPLRITKVNPEVKDRQFEVDLVFNEEQPDNILIGKNYRIQIELEQPEDAIVIPKGNFFQATGGQWIFKLTGSGNKAIRTPLTIGRQNPQQYEILDGLQPGDRVIITGYDNFGDAAEVVLN